MSDLSAQLYQVLLRATPEQVWEAITSPDRTRLYFHGAHVENTAEWHTSRGPDGADWGDGPVWEFDPPRRLVHEWRSAYDPELAKEPPSRVTWEIEDVGDGSCRLTVVHDRLGDSPGTAGSVSGEGWGSVLDGLARLLEQVSAP